MSRKDKVIVLGLGATVALSILPQAVNLYDLIRDKCSGSVRHRNLVGR